MSWIRRHKTISVIGLVTVGIILLSAMQYILYYYSNPVKKEIEISVTGCLIYGPDFNTYEPADVKIKMETLQYVFKNQRDAIQGNIWVNGYGIFGYGGEHDIGFYVEFIGDSEYSCVQMKEGTEFAGRTIAISKNADKIICGLAGNANIRNRLPLQTEEEILLVIPASDRESAVNMVLDVSLASEQFARWLSGLNWEL